MNATVQTWCYKIINEKVNNKNKRNALSAVGPHMIDYDLKVPRRG